MTTFVTAARKAGLELKVFIDAGIESDEALAKWRSRREEDVKLERRDVPQGNSVLVGDIFHSLGVEVLYSAANQDLDDCLASFAFHDRASILSNDGDYFRYRKRNWEQFGKFKIQNGNLLLCCRYENPNKEKPSARDILAPKPTMCTEDPSMVTVISHKTYKRGAPSALVKLCGNPHGKVIPLRQALYAKMGILEKVLEEWPEWDETERKVTWHQEYVSPNPDTSLFELTPEELFHKFFSQEKRPNFKDLEDWEWENHLFACRAITCEIWLIGQLDRKKDVSLLSLMTHYVGSDVDTLSAMMSGVSLSTPKIELAPETCDNYRTMGYCRFGDSCFQSSGHKRCPYYNQGCCRRAQNCPFFHSY